jgi:hypothetical protein
MQCDSGGCEYRIASFSRIFRPYVYHSGGLDTDRGFPRGASFRILFSLCLRGYFHGVLKGIGKVHPSYGAQCFLYLCASHLVVLFDSPSQSHVLVVDPLFPHILGFMRFGANDLLLCNVSQGRKASCEFDEKLKFANPFHYEIRRKKC